MARKFQALQPQTQQSRTASSEMHEHSMAALQQQTQQSMAVSAERHARLMETCMVEPEQGQTLKTEDLLGATRAGASRGDGDWTRYQCVPI
jgi:hypothetical protein